ncbi:PIG-L deacetylase family protein [Aliiglaciecola sp. M165]|uniref:PIG-L deacetylase family protein n=1 Tax=Aliiglaciecola sp. M165 TaxID=2593649 RepID=UPI00117C73AD|nr:PIG-L deacetylase family protein [Aliiglaciecola sp. M165]TRY30950.1 PIG-L family deacetylase [Aliiglaciecola sp. M165]
MSKVLVIAPHPDDETLGCGGTLLKHRANEDELHWLIVTDMSASSDYSQYDKLKRQEVIENVTHEYNFLSRMQLSYSPASLDEIPKRELVGKISEAIQRVCPEILYIPYRNDVHSDHEVVFDASVAATKQFRMPSIQEILAYETLSETDFCLKPGNVFSPNYYVNIDGFLEKKKTILSLYQSELGEFPFPRSLEAVDALAKVRGVQANVIASEAFMLLKKVWS